MQATIYTFKARTIREAAELASGIPPRSVHRVEIEPMAAGGWGCRLETSASEATVREVARCIGPPWLLAATLRRVAPESS